MGGVAFAVLFMYLESMEQKFTLGRPFSASLKEYARGIAGGLIFSFPLLYTMEIWWHGFIAGPAQFIALVCATFLLLLGYNRYAGMREDLSFRSVMVDSIEEMGIGSVVSFGVLLMLGRIHFSGMGMDEIMGKVVVEAMAVSIGVSIGTAQLGADSGGGKGSSKVSSSEEGGKGKASRSSRLGSAILALCGAIVVGGNVAPTQEIPMIAFEVDSLHIFSMVLVSLLISLVVVFYCDFRGAPKKLNKSVAFTVIFDVCISYLAALSSAAFLLWFFGRFENTSFEESFAQCVVLGVIAILGASAGRLLIK